VQVSLALYNKTMKKLSDEEFHETLHLEDELGSVIRAHLHIENMLDQLLAKQFPVVERLEELDLTYKDKIVLSLAMGFNEEFKPVLMGVGEIRNKFAHKPDFEITKQDTNNLYKAFPTEEKELIHKTIKSVNEATGNNLLFNSMNPREKFIIMVVVLRQIIFVAVRSWPACITS
jgi:hypothetical protein